MIVKLQSSRMFVSSSTVQAPLLLGEWEIHYLHKSEGGAGLQLQWGRKQAISSFLKLLYILNKLSTWRLKGYFNWLRFLAWFFYSLSVFCYFLYMVFCYASIIYPFTFHPHSHIDSYRNSHFTSRVSNFMFSQRLLIENKIRFSKKTLFYSKNVIQSKMKFSFLA